MKWLRRYLDEKSPTLKNFPKVRPSREAQVSPPVPDSCQSRRREGRLVTCKRHPLTSP